MAEPFSDGNPVPISTVNPASSGNITTSYNFEVLVGQTSLPTNRFTIAGGSNGSIGHAMVSTTRAILNSSNIDLFSISANAATLLEVIINIIPSDGSKIRIFGGEYTATEWHYDSDIITIHARDYAGVLADQKKVLSSLANLITQVISPLTPGQNPTAGVSTQNTKISEIVTAIANEFSLTPVLNLGQDVTYGSIFGNDDTVFMPVPQTLWAILNQLARETGNEVYVTPNKELVFGIPGAGLPTLNVVWNVSPNAPDLQVADTYPCRNPIIQHNPRRNSSFRVIVFSYYPSSKTNIVGQATVISPNLSGIGGLTTGLFSGPQAVAVNKQIEKQQNSKTGNVTIPLYSFHIDGLNQSQADAKAASIATDISKHDLSVRMELDILPGLRPTQIFKLGNAFDSDFQGVNFYTNQYSHTFTMPRQSEAPRRNRGGLLTIIHALNIPVGSLIGGGE